MEMDRYISSLHQAENVCSTPEAPNRISSSTDTVTLSPQAHQAAIASQLEQSATLSSEASEELPSGNVTLAEPDWDTIQLSSLQINPEPILYEKVWENTISKEFDTLKAQVQAYYEPILSKTKGMDANEAMLYLCQTYKMPWLGEHFAEAPPIPDPPEGMSKREAELAHDQLVSLFFGSAPTVIRAPYALGAEGIARFYHAWELVDEAVQAAYDAAQKELDAKQVDATPLWEAPPQQNTQAINTSGSESRLGSMHLDQQA